MWVNLPGTFSCTVNRNRNSCRSACITVCLEPLPRCVSGELVFDYSDEHLYPGFCMFKYVLGQMVCSEIESNIGENV